MGQMCGSSDDYNLGAGGKPTFIGATPLERKTNTENAMELQIYNEFTADCSPDVLAHIIPDQIDLVRATTGPDGVKFVTHVEKIGWPMEGTEYHYSFADGRVMVETFDKIDLKNGWVHYWYPAGDLQPAFGPFFERFEGNYIMNPVPGQPNKTQVIWYYKLTPKVGGDEIK